MTTIDRQVQTAAAPTLQRIRDDRDGAPHRIKPLLSYVEAHLFDADLDASTLKKACGVRDNTLPMIFHNAVSLPPYAYIEDCRMAVARQLLTDTDLKVWQIAQRLGYSALQVFSRAFERRCGVRPSVYRLKAQPAETAAAGGRADGSKKPLAEVLIRAMQGDLARNEADELARRLSDLYPESFSMSTSSSGRCEEPQPGG